jgi:hypothetical protein
MFLNVSPAGYAPRGAVDGIRSFQRITLEYVITAADLAVDGFDGFVLRSNHNNDQNLPIHDFFVHNVEIVRFGLADLLQSPGTVMWSLSSDAMVQDMSLGQTTGFTTAHQFFYQGRQATLPTSIVAGPYGNAIRVDGRTSDWHGLDLSWRALPAHFLVHSYELIVRGRVVDPVEGEQFSLNRNLEPWGELLRGSDHNENPRSAVAVDEDGLFEIVVPFNTELMTRNRTQPTTPEIRLQTGPGSTSSFIIYDIQLVVVGVSGAGAADEVILPAQAADDAVEDVAVAVE